ncbi:AraC family transcriptional regulator [Aliiglaciecola sp. CAU 1673]|uniref:helix-turn-helix transcriptional regulator n=1 Tax=Aliiglaciecola sp. CAU 1673 TaxID=3032595 RepID=UPI0023DC76F3|nr:AraC family transcriptional regulator [Aliiglaciecola sp. CAU 1673]MDF2176879.1 AraC family transcriptional regulator [Aliiglaciecola sp. CAU 1673]
MPQVFLAIAAMAVASFTLLVLLFQGPSQSKSPLMLVLLCLFCVSTGPVVFTFFPSLKQLYISALPLLFFTLLPGIWFYHEALTAQGQWGWKWDMWEHIAPLPVAGLLGIALILLPSAAFNAMFFAEYPGDDSWITILSMAFFAAVVIWCVLSCFYLIKLNLRSADYRRRLKDVYSNEQGKSLKWLSGISLLIVLAWVYALVVLAFEDRLAFIGLSETGVLVLLVVIVWVISANGLRQRPGFEEASLPEKAVSPQKSKKTYERSALTSDDLSHIAAKLTAAIQGANAHLDPDLTLAKLSALTGEPPQYVSQTLSQHLNTTFFDFINFARIDHAKRLLVESNQSVLDIALATGFNSRSSFYKAFKQYTGLTPSQYRSAQKT